MAGKPRLLFVGAFPPPDRRVYGGALTACQCLLRSSFPKRVELELIDSTQVSNPAPPFFCRLRLALRRFSSYVRRFEEWGPDAVLIFSSSGWASSLEKGLMSWYSRLRGVPSLLFPRGGILIERCRRSRFATMWVRLMFRSAQKVLCQGPAWQRFAIEQMGFTPDDAPVIPNWTASERFLDIGRKRFKIDREGPVRLLFLGWLERHKGIFELIEACHRISRDSDFQLDIAGEGNASEDVRRLIEERGLKDRVRLLGWIEGQDLECALAESDVLVLPSWNEGLPNAMIEAMASGLAVVITPVGNIPDFVTDEQEALLIPPRDPESLAKALGRVINDPDLRAKIAHRGHLFVSEAFAVEPAVLKLVSAVEDSISESCHRHRQ